MEIDLINNDFDYNKIEETIKNKKIKLIEIQRSKGYSTRKSLIVDKVNKVYDFIKNIDKDIIVMIDNCYCEFVSKEELKGDIVVGSLIKNLGGGIAPNGAYIVGNKDLIELISERLTLPGEGREVGPTLGINKDILMGLYFAPGVVKSALKTSILTSYVMEKLGFDVEPKYNDIRADIVQNITFNDPDKLVKYCEIIQGSSPIDSNVKPVPWDMPGYDDQVVMAAGTFTQGSSIELSCDGPIREPFIAYQQGSLTYEYGRLAIMNIYSQFKTTTY
jgi:cystathionine beta-lyase family protein involved in aluminum resistance